MTRAEFAELLRSAPLIASAQASSGSPLANPEAIWQIAKASLDQKVKVLRLEGVESIQRVRQEFSGPIVGLIKKEYEGSSVYITPTSKEVKVLLDLGCEAIAIDATNRIRPNGENLSHLIQQIHSAGRLAWADCDTEESADEAVRLGADVISTTLAGYTENREPTAGPDLELLRSISVPADRILVAEGKFYEPWQVETALRIGANAVVVGGALNDPVKQTQRFLNPVLTSGQKVCGVDIGGTWLRAATFDSNWHILKQDRIPLPESQKERMYWIESFIRRNGISKVGISSGGVIDPKTATVVSAKDIIGDYVGAQFAWQDVDVWALNDGLATAWGQACHPLHAGRKVATIALGTGVGAGYVINHMVQVGKNGEYPRLNDIPLMDGDTVEEVLGGQNIDPNFANWEDITLTAQRVIKVVDETWMPDDIVICGGVGMSNEIKHGLRQIETNANLSWSPFGSESGLYGAAALALFPPRNIWP